MLPQLSQINNWPCHTESVPRAVYTDACTKVTWCKKISEISRPHDFGLQFT